MQFNRQGNVGILKTLSLLTTLSLYALLLFTGVSVHAQNDLPTAAVWPAGPSLHDMVQGRQREMQQDSVATLLRSLPRSLSQTLNLSDEQAVSLDEIYNGFAMGRVEQESKIVKWQIDLQKAQALATFNQRKAAGLLQNIVGAQRVISNTFIQARANAIKVLTPGQRIQLQNIAVALPSNAQSSVGAVDAPPLGPAPSRDAYFQLLLMPAADILQTPVDTQTVRRWKSDRNRAAYTNRSVFGSYSFGLGGRASFGFGRGDGHGYFGHHPHHGGGSGHH